jgi:hypothetical protein
MSGLKSSGFAKVGMFCLCAVALWVRSTGAAAQAPCPDGVCSAGRCERGVCLPDACRDADACFGASFEDGDCDRDLVPNRSDGTLCEGVIVTFDVAFGFFPLSGSGLRRSASDGWTEVAPGVWSDVPNALAIGCTAMDRCPTLPDFESRCVFPLGSLQGGRLGICTYAQDTRNDRTCIESPEVPGDSCLAGGGLPPRMGYPDWARGDCDGDGLPNEQDSRVCNQLQVIGPAPGPGLDLVCTPGVVTRPDRVACSVARELAPGIVGCAQEVSGAVLPALALCCSGQADCPVLADATMPRCVRVPGTPPSGVCTYGPGATPRDDLSCIALGRPLSATCFVGRTPGEYDSWASGDCDECRPSNGEDDAVCACPPEDAGVDAGAGETDAGVVPIVDAGTDAGVVPVVDAGTDAGGLDAGPIDAGPLERPSRHSGCGCAAAGGRTASGLFWSALAALVCGLRARSTRGARASTPTAGSRRHAAASSRHAP